METKDLILTSIEKNELQDWMQSVIREEVKNNLLAIGDQKELEELLTREEVAKIYRTSLVTLRQWEIDGIIPTPIRKGTRVLFRKSDIIADIQGKPKHKQG